MMQRHASVVTAEADTLVDLLRLRCATEPARPLYTFLHDDDQHSRLTHEQLDRRARAIAARLQGEGLSGERVLLVYPPGLEFVAAFFGCLYAGAVAVPAYPPRPNRPLRRIFSIVADCSARAALTSSELAAQAAAAVSAAPELSALRWLATDRVCDSAAGDYRAWSPTPQSLAFLQYTSGSTGDPKGVMVSHGNLLHNVGLIQHGFQVTPEDVGVSWLPMYHDMGLIGCVLGPLYTRVPVVLMSPLRFLQRPVSWLEAFSQWGGTCGGAPNFAYELCAERVTPEQLAALDLSRWKVAFCGAEPVRAETLRRFAEVFAPCGFRRESFYPCFGLAESTLIASGGSGPGMPASLTVDDEALGQGRARLVAAEHPRARTLVSCGAPLLDQELWIVDPRTRRPCAADEVGEIWLRGPSVAQGYWNRPALSHETFAAQLADGDEGPFLRSGDLGFLHDGELFVAGRLKDVIILRGRNFYPQDLELSVERAHPLLRPHGGAAFALESSQGEQLVLVHEVTRQCRAADAAAVIESIRQAVAAEHDVQPAAVVLVRMATIPKTSSGKIRRRACREQYLAGELSVVGQWQAAEPAIPFHPPDVAAHGNGRHGGNGRAAAAAEELTAWLCQQIARQLEVDSASVQPSTPLDQLPLESLSATLLSGALADRLGRRVSPAAMYESATIAAMTARLAEAPPEPAAEASAAPPATSRWPLSHAQRSFWLLQQAAPASCAYHVALAAQVEGTLDHAALDRALAALAARHELLRASFPSDGDEPHCVVAPRSVPPVERKLARDWSPQRLAAELESCYAEPFDLERGPLWRVVLLERSPREHVLLVVLHHLVCDGWSAWTLLDELGQLYAAQAGGQPANLPPPPRYADYVAEQRQLLAGPAGAELEAWWREQIAELPTLELPTDLPRPAGLPQRGGSIPLAIPAELTARLRRLAADEGVTLYVVLLAAWKLLLSRYSGQREIVVGTPMSGRTRAHHADLVGPLVNPVVLRSEIRDEQGFRTLLSHVRSVVRAGIARQDYPLPLLVERAAAAREPGRSPLFQVSLVYQQPQRLPQAAALLAPRGSASAIAWGGLTLRGVPLRQQEGQLDLTLELIEADGTLQGWLKFRDDLWSAPSIERMAANLVRLLESIVADPDAPVAGLPLVSLDEERLVLERWNATDRPFRLDRCLHQWIEDQAARTPDAPAVTFAEQTLSYWQLNARANRLARWLRSAGVQPDQPVGVYLERSVEMVVALLGTLKSGGAYLPLDPGYPAGRLQAMLDEARPAVLLTHSRLSGSLPRSAAQLVELDQPPRALAELSGDDPPCTAQPDHLAYVIYTSGSTGKPKGVMISHRGICNRLLWMQEALQLSADDVVLQKTPFSFDVSVWEFFWPLMVGARLVVARPEGHRDAAYLAELIHQQRVTTLHFVPSMLQVFLDEADPARLGSLRRVVCSGEALPLELARALHRAAAVRLYNLYGPTEASVDVTCWECPPDWAGHGVPIGRPIANTRTYVLDAAQRPLPIGVAGRLFLGGVGLARGYWNQPQLTAERFVEVSLPGRGRERLYDTGDLARWLPDGTLEFLGRGDDQVKLGGNRIELGEVAAALQSHPAVRQAAVVLRGEGSAAHLAAYVVPRGQPLPAADLRRYLAERLPAYMIPAALVWLDAIPLSPSGKLDRRALPAPPLEPDRHDDWSAPETPAERALAEIWRDVLGLARVGRHDDWFALGGGSLQALRMVARARAAGLAISPELAFRRTTLVRLAAACQSPGGNGRQHCPNLEVDARLDDALRPAGSVVAGEPRAVLLTGATGFLGAWLLRELLERTAAEIHCLVRARSQSEALDRLRSALARFALPGDDLTGRVRAVPGDLSRPSWGLAAADFARLAESVDAVLHNGAAVNFLWSYEQLRSANVEAVREALRLASLGRAKSLHCVSTISVFDLAAHAPGGPLDETTPLRPIDPQRGTGYAQSKWVAEALLAAAAERGFAVSVYRPGTILGSSVSGAANADDLLSRAARAFVQLGAAPRLDAAFRVAPVDAVARAIVGLLRRGQADPRPHHLFDAQPLSLDELVDSLRAAGESVEWLDFSAWRRLALSREDHALAPFLPLLSRSDSTASTESLGLMSAAQAARLAADQTSFRLAPLRLHNATPAARVLTATWANFRAAGLFVPAPEPGTRR